MKSDKAMKSKWFLFLLILDRLISLIGIPLGMGILTMFIGAAIGYTEPFGIPFYIGVIIGLPLCIFAVATTSKDELLVVW